MSAGRSASFLVMVCFLLHSSEAQKIITAVVGQEVILPCKVNDKNKTILAVKWSRPDLDPEYVFLYRDGHFDSKHQLPSYQNRVDLQDREMKDGDISLILKDVKKNDTGRYKCRVSQRGTNHINIIYLVVGPSGHKDGGDKDGGDKDGGGKDGGDKAVGDKDGGDKDGGDKVGIILGVVVPILLAVMASVGFLVYRHNRQNSNLPGEQML